MSAVWDDREYGAQKVVPLSGLKISFDRVWPWLAKAVAEYGPTHRKWHVWKVIEAEDAQLWTSEKAAIVTSIQIWPNGFKELTHWLAAGDLDEALELNPIVEAWAAEKGCDRIVLPSGRKGWLRVLPGYRAIAATIVKDL